MRDTDRSAKTVGDVVANSAAEARQRESERKRLYYQLNRDAIKAKNAQWKKENADKARLHAEAYRLRHRSELRAKAESYYESNKEVINEKSRLRYALNTNEIRERIRSRRAGAQVVRGKAPSLPFPRKARLGETHGRARLGRRQVKAIRAWAAQFLDGATAPPWTSKAKEMNVGEGTLRDIVKRRTWRHIP